MSRYELSEGTSNKFWEIKISAKSFTTTYGKIGTKGQSTIKTFGSEAEAKKEAAKLVAEKVKKGYALAGTAAATKEPEEAEPKAARTKSKDKKAGADAGPSAGGGSAVTSASGTPGARYFEMVEGTSNKFWEVHLDGTNVSTRYGKIGTPGQKTVKENDSRSEAFKELEKLVAEKTKKGYVEIGVAASEEDGAVRDARNPELEKAIERDPDNRDALAVYSDWLQEQGDPRGELIALQLANKHADAKKLIAKHKDHFLGPLAEHMKTRDGLANNSQSHLRTNAEEKEWQKTGEEAFLWRNGFIHRVRLSHDSYADSDWEGSCAEVLDQVLRHPSGRFVVEFSFQSNGDPNEDDLQDLIDLLGKKAPQTTRKITFGDNVDQISWHHTGKLHKLWKGVPNLKVLEIETGDFDVGPMDAPSLERAIFITGGLSKTCGRNIATGSMPKIRHLEVYYGTDNYGGDCTIKDVQPLLDRTDLKQLEYLGVKNSMFADDIAKAIAEGPKILKGLKTLDLSLGTITDAGAKALANAKSALAHLECLDLTRNYLTKEGVKAVKGICPKVITDGQEAADEDGDDTYYYVAIAE